MCLIAAHRPRFKSNREDHRRLLDQFLRAVGLGEMDGLMHLLADDVTMWAASLGKALQRPVGEDLFLQGGMNRRELVGVYGGPDAIGVRLVASGRAHLVRNY